MKQAPERRTSPPHIDIQMQSPLWSAQPLAPQTVREAVDAAASALSTEGGEVSILLTDDSEIARLNRDWRGIDKSTNVLSFPASGHRAGQGEKLLGDIVIAYETLERESKDESRDFLHHLAHLAVHGFLHLFCLRVGFVIEADEGEKTVHCEMCKVVKEVPAFILRFPFERLVGNDDVAKQFLALTRTMTGSRERQHVGRLVNSTPIAIESGDLRIVGEQDTHFAALC